MQGLSPRIGFGFRFYDLHLRMLRETDAFAHALAYTNANAVPDARADAGTDATNPCADIRPNGDADSDANLCTDVRADALANSRADTSIES